MLKPFQIRDLHRSPSLSSSDETSDLDHPLSPTRRTGIVQLSASQYDSLSSTHPRARLTYNDEDDGELITVGSSFELSQRLEEHVNADIDYISVSQTTLEPMHVFDIRRSNSVTELWKKYECKQGKQGKQAVQESKEIDDAPAEPTPAETPAPAIQQPGEHPDFSPRDAHATENEESPSLLAAFEAEMAKFLSTPQPAADTTPSAQPSTSTSSIQSYPDSRSTRSQNATDAFTHAMQSLIDGAEMLSFGVMSRLPEIERQLQHAQRAIPENVGSSMQGALATLEAQLRQVTNSLSNSPAVSAQVASILEGELPTATRTAESLRSMASELGNLGHTLFEAFEAELGCTRARPQQQSPASAAEYQNSENSVPDRNADITQASNAKPSSEQPEPTTGLEEKSSTKENDEAPDAGLHENASSRFEPSRHTSEPIVRPSDYLRRPMKLEPLMHHPHSQYHESSPHNHHPHAPPHPPFFHPPPPPHWPPPLISHPTWPFATPPELHNGYPSAPPPPLPPSPPIQSAKSPSLNAEEHSHRCRPQLRHSGGYNLPPTAPAHNEKVPTNASPTPSDARDVQLSENTALFIGNVGFNVSEKMISDVFASKGFLIKVHLPQESETGKHAGFGYLQFPSVHAAKAALDALQGEHIDGHAINLEFSDHSPILGLQPPEAHSQPSSLASVTPLATRPSELQGSVASSLTHGPNDARSKSAVKSTPADLCSEMKHKQDGAISTNGSEKLSEEDAERLNILFPSVLPGGPLQSSRSNSIPSNLSDWTADIDHHRFPPISQIEAQFRATHCHPTTRARGVSPDERPERLNANSTSWDIPGTYHQESNDDAARPSGTSQSRYKPDALGSSLGSHRHYRRSRTMKYPRSSWHGPGASGSVETGPSRHSHGRPKPGFHHRGSLHESPTNSPSRTPQISPEMQQRSIDACVATLVDLGYGGENDGGLQRIAVYAAAADANVLEAIDMIEEERKAYEQQRNMM
ncbi:uncharacterized protein BP01DRAFT_304575 [Aspergillus saccharolyticus JOP 1030-1]|uniref:RRM domain-containing protein n=1 Tax=Aspergillus saccharolyticus JOP 1030-1 TaxID=1450539 RepID=A0A319A359_9EURO|nr:hypothetical protein BP01DRAFT_304575 [Aspergillus saccharolyticus JOP 1030-1]PYH41902.1 hypothetical protein BP01DRAFT_304575 [Aspergillus saccharolyticus JOP 1030-1]